MCLEGEREGDGRRWIMCDPWADGRRLALWSAWADSEQRGDVICWWGVLWPESQVGFRGNCELPGPRPITEEHGISAGEKW